MNRSPAPEGIDFNTPAMQRKRRARAFKDRLTRWYVALGGMAVLAAITLIFFYLAWVVAPLFKGASLNVAAPMTPAWMQAAGKPLMISIEEQNQVGMRISDQGQAIFFDVSSGAQLKQMALPLPEGVQITAIGKDQPGTPLIAVGLSNGQVLVFRHAYEVSYPNNQKTITPAIAWPYGQAPLTLDEQGQAIGQVTVSVSGSHLRLAGSTGTQLHVLAVELGENPQTGEVLREQSRIELPQLSAEVKAIYIDPRQQWLYVINGRAQADVFSLRDRTLNGRYKLLENANAEITSSTQLVGGVSLLFGDSRGGISQWFMVRDTDEEPRFMRIRDFRLGDAPIVQIRAEQRRKGFVALDSTGQLGVFHSTAHRTLLVEKVTDGAGLMTLSPRANQILIESGGTLRGVGLDNPHPEISWSALWEKVWYENYDEPRHVWQSTASTTDYEPKLSLAPLTYGTLKAAFYAMLLAAPLAIAAAIYTAYFMAPVMRRKVKPVIELMEAMPTVILGFFAGLFLAPYMEANLPGIFALMLLTPVGILLAGFLWSRLPISLRLRVPDGWEAAILIPVVLGVGWLSLGMSPHLESWLFDGDMRTWISHDLGITFDQRNALVIGLAMGFAVIPNIYSIAEDAIFGVPRSLTLGSLALGATPWQTLTRVVLLTASPGLFSALMIGMGRAVGETMIVLMATGNTPIMDMNLFEGMRTLAANVAVEMPESEVGSSHYRVLFLAALVLLMFTFVMNTLAELIRQRLRKQYSLL
ncbi:ABC transporter permease subunit [Pseudomonas sp. 21LCFQ02]|uniref:ABC transporter permease subunit n=1 Tax=unclassified Pseudomonas TaxID=196821 RepID=UPI0020973134|nr:MULTISPECIES: ABC transporter permease subunit [unclassified Pseudomonas]MCO8165654.1 ABC transporter permease subunit [Pseudomonas sp. 21LCFQ010]MCO8171068.1 ABC transporter permease subunit [Pseudomonas sp. 21LCFQ02]MCQ9426949.1 ABC transporter permease subunit [Pseudomonas sp. LJDD11]